MTQFSKQKIEEFKKTLEGKKQAPQEIPETKPPSEEMTQLKTELEKAKEEAKQNHDRWLRTTAEFENYKKRSAKENQDQIKFAVEKMAKELLITLDDFDRLLSHLPKEENAEMKHLIEGVQLIHRHLLNALHKFHIKEVETKNKKFDPHLHEAIAQVEREDLEEGMIAECFRKGYQIHDRLLRAASVSLAKAKIKNNEN